MNWITPQNNGTCHDVRFAERSPAGIAAEFIEFWRNFAEIVLPANRAKAVQWDFLNIVLQGPEGRIQVWPDHSGNKDIPPVDRPLVCWASIYIVALEDFYDEVDDDVYGTPEFEAEKMRWMRMLVDGAEAVHFADLAGFGEQGLPARFYVYDGDEPIWETMIGGMRGGKE